MEKAIFTDRTPILLHPEPANTSPRDRANKDFARWLFGTGKDPAVLRWRNASMKTAFYSRQPAPAPGTPWHEVASKGLSPWVWAEICRRPTYWAWARWGLNVTLKDAALYPDKMYYFALRYLHE